MALAQTGKQRAKGVPLDYFKSPGALGRWRQRLTLAALAIALGWWISGLELDRGGWPIRQSAQGRLRASRGPVARVHAAWEANCNACHVPFDPIVPGHWWDSHPGGVGSTSDQRCIACHAGPPHHAKELPADSQSCAGCHREHRGREASLTRLPDSDCTRCHGNLSAHIRKDAKAAGYTKVTSFAADHPEFRAVKGGNSARDSANIEFNHALHMTSGIVRKPGDVPFTLARMAQIGDPADRNRYRNSGQADSDPVQLECTSCHRNDGGDFGLAPSAPARTARVPARSSGAHMLPIVYENQCRACHPLTIEATPGADAPRPGRVVVSHGLQPDELHDELERAFVARYLSEHPDLLEETAVRSRVPGSGQSPVATKARKAIDEAVFRAERILYLGKQTCSECHRYETAGNHSPAELLAPGEYPRLRVKPTAIRQVWFEHAAFDHSAHRALSCRECHARAYPKDLKGEDDSISSGDVLLPGIATCRACHAPTHLAQGPPRGGAAHDCAECHRYHNGDAPLQGLGAARRGANREHRIEDFLSAPDRRPNERRP